MIVDLFKLLAKYNMEILDNYRFQELEKISWEGTFSE
jgi:hypothetical protein